MRRFIQVKRYQCNIIQEKITNQTSILRDICDINVKWHLNPFYDAFSCFDSLVILMGCVQGWNKLLTVMMASNYVTVSGVLCAGNTCMGSRYGWLCAYTMGIYLAPRNSPRHWYHGQCACLCQVAGFSPSQMTSIVFFSALSHVFLISFFRFIFVLK